MFVLDNEDDSNSNIELNVTENHSLLYYNLPKQIIENLNLSLDDILEYDVRNEKFYCRKKGSQWKPSKFDNTIFSGLKVERTITKNNTILRTNLPKEVTQPLSIKKGDFVEISLKGKLIIGKKITKEI